MQDLGGMEAMPATEMLMVELVELVCLIRFLERLLIMLVGEAVGPLQQQELEDWEVVERGQVQGLQLPEPQTPAEEAVEPSMAMGGMVDRVSWSCVTKERKPLETMERSPVSRITQLPTQFIVSPLSAVTRSAFPRWI